MKKTNHKSKILKHSYLKEEVKNYADIFSDCVKQFMDDCPEYQEYMTDLKKEVESKSEDESENMKSKTKDLKKLYRRISKLTHPDKTKSSYLTKIFTKSSEDYQEKRIGSLYCTAITLDIDVSDLNLQFILDEIDSEITTYEESLDKFTGSIPWKWVHAKDEDEKDFLKEQINNFFGIKK